MSDAKISSSLIQLNERIGQLARFPTCLAAFLSQLSKYPAVDDTNQYKLLIDEVQGYQKNVSKRLRRMVKDLAVVFITYKDFNGDTEIEVDNGIQDSDDNHDDFDDEDFDQDFGEIGDTNRDSVEKKKYEDCERVIRNATSRRIVTNNVEKLKSGIMKFILTLNAIRNFVRDNSEQGKETTEQKISIVEVLESIDSLRDSLYVIYSICDIFDDIEEIQSSTSGPLGRVQIYDIMRSKANEIIKSCEAFLMHQ